jgi:hypothetical protein
MRHHTIVTQSDQLHTSKTYFLHCVKRSTSTASHKAHYFHSSLANPPGTDEKVKKPAALARV